MITSPAAFHTLLSREFFETLDKYEPLEEFTGIVEPMLDESWMVRRGGFWTYVHCEQGADIYDGWKIHVSSTEEHGAETLRRVVPVLVRSHTSFKFCSDSRMLALSLSKTWPRSGAGKFMTIYPRDFDGFKALVEECHEATAGLVGPFILSDRPYRDSRTVYYRYGEHYGRRRVNAYGNAAPIIIGPDGQEFSDERVAYFRLPPWVTDPFNPAPQLTPPGEDGVLLKDRYRVKMAIKFSSVGGVYQALDTESGEDVIIREARPRLGREAIGYDAVRLLEKEARILRKLDGTGLAPAFIDLFTQWEHSFLVQELLHAESLWGYAMDFPFEEGASPQSMFRGIRRTAQEIIRALEIVHAKGIVIRDMTRSNVLFTEDGRLKFIDFEFAYELDGIDPIVAGWTPGYASPEQLRNEPPRIEEDHYALGALLLDMMAFTAPGLELNRDGLLRMFEVDISDLRLPKELVAIVLGLTAVNVSERWSAKRALQVLNDIEEPRDTTPLFPSRAAWAFATSPVDALRLDAQHIIDGIVRFTRHHATFERDDRLWPASGEIFNTNPVHLQYGAAGTAYFLTHAAGGLEERERQWILHHLDTRALPATLFSGAGGVALLLCDIGEESAARELIGRYAGRNDYLDLPNLYYGAAGWGIALLGIWQKTRDDEFLSQACQVGDDLLNNARENDRGLSWEADGYVRLGYGEGQSGTAAFYFFLYAATHDERYLDAAQRSLDFDLSYAVDAATGVLWFPHTESGPGEPKSPHMRFGTVGVGSVAIRAWAITGHDRYLDWAKQCASSVAKRYTNKLWHDYGTAGYGEFLLDMYHFTGEKEYLDVAWYHAERLMAGRIERDEGIAFLGRDLLRLSCDYSMGSAGIGLFLARLLDPTMPRLILPDRLLESAERRHSSEPGALQEGLAYA